MKKCESGLTLIEMLTAVSIITIMAGTTYAVFNTSIKAYRMTQTKLIQAQRCRFAMDQIVKDLSQIQADTSNEMLALFSEDAPSASGDRDILSFVTLVKTDPDPFTAQATPNILSDPPLSDVRRVAYYVGPKVPMQEIKNRGVVPPPDTAAQQLRQNQTGAAENLALYRIVTTTLNPELVVNAFMDSGTKPTVDENGDPVLDFTVTRLVDGIVNFDLKYTDGEALYDSWDQEDAIPITVQILISVIDENRQESASTPTFADSGAVLPKGTLTQSTMVYLPASANTNGAGQ